MPKKKGQKKAKHTTIYRDIKEQQHEDLTIIEEEFDIKKSKAKSEKLEVTDDHGFVYPEIVWYLISFFIEPKDISTFAAINKATYSITRRESFWFSIYKKYCEKDKRLPERLKIGDNYRAYGLRQRVVRALYFTYEPFIERLDSEQKMCPHTLCKRRCVNTWYYKGQSYWNVYIKLKKQGHFENVISKDEGRVDANPEENTKVLQICCNHVYNIPPLMGMTLTRFSLSYQSPGLKLEMGFSSPYDGPNTRPIQTVVLDSVAKWFIYDWWHPNYPHFEVKPPPLMKSEESAPLLDVDFFELTDEDLSEDR